MKAVVAPRREPSGRIISRIYAAWASEQTDVVPGTYADNDNEHSLLIDAPPQAQDDLTRRTTDAFRASGYDRTGRPMDRISHQQAKRYVDAYLSAEGSATIAGTASRFGSVWLVSEIEPDHPDEMLLGRALAVFDDGAVYSTGSLPPQHEIQSLLDRLDPNRPRFV